MSDDFKARTILQKSPWTFYQTEHKILATWWLPVKWPLGIERLEKEF